ncbi:DUF6261 family protein [Capnocytophaga sp.]|uniref:DUF6261 family protein n=1 Tax=Capnocytophaga sp. TaxID=44737 RepID=UPI0026DBF3F3|nr:DUF6261 family protein [Capnocytophaga sp.]MDO5106006.1 DUF6261 family protein [Capnocytophaga sp.]
MKLTYRNLSTKSLATLAEQVINASKSGKYQVTENHPLLTQLENEYDIYYKAYSKQTFSGKGKVVSEAGNARGKAFADLKIFLEGYTRLAIAPNHADAVALYDIFKFYGLNIDRKSYADSAAQFKKLIEALATTENQERLQRLAITPAFENLKNKCDEFNTLYAEQAEANAELRQKKSATTLRKQLEEALRNYLTMITAMRSLAGWDTLFAELNEIVKSVR